MCRPSNNVIYNKNHHFHGSPFWCDVHIRKCTKFDPIAGGTRTPPLLSWPFEPRTQTQHTHILVRGAATGLAGERVYHVWDILSEFLGNNFVSGLRTLKPKKPKNFSNKKLIRRWDSERELSLRRHRTCTTKHSEPSIKRVWPTVVLAQCRMTSLLCRKGRHLEPQVRRSDRPFLWQLLTPIYILQPNLLSTLTLTT